MLSNGTDYEIDWPKFQPGSSIFIPAIDTDDAVEAMTRESKRLEFEFVYKVVVEKGVKGIRVWRL